MSNQPTTDPTKRQRPFTRYSTAQLAKMLSACPPSSATRRELQRELRIRLDQAIRQIEQEFDLPSENKRCRRPKRHFLRRLSAAQQQTKQRET
jgi:hypothetical protein